MLPFSMDTGLLDQIYLAINVEVSRSYNAPKIFSVKKVRFNFGLGPTLKRVSFWFYARVSKNILDPSELLTSSSNTLKTYSSILLTVFSACDGLSV